jgi:NO-binding membrane sensor protein with MHYT domain/two-component sensor histidine kinase
LNLSDRGHATLRQMAQFWVCWQTHPVLYIYQVPPLLRVLDCFTQQHEYRLVLLAIFVCALGSYAAITLLNHVRIVQGRARWVWLAATAGASGFAIWATHFIAMLAFSPGGPAGYDLLLTLLSLVAAITLTGFASYATTFGDRLMKAIGGAMVGGGIAATHFTGMAAFHVAGFIVWDGALVAASIALGCALGAAALVIGASNTRWSTRLQAALLLTLAILSHHFTAMGAASIVRDPTIVVSASALPPGAMALGVAFGGLAILALTFTGVGLDLRDRRRTAAFVRDITAAKEAEEHQNLLIAELNHRVKNALARVAAVARRTGDTNGTIDDFVAALDGRIRSMANAHELLSQSRWQGVSLADLVRRELAPYATADNTATEGPEVTLTATATQTIAMVLHELATNAAKYGALSGPPGRVNVCWSKTNKPAGEPQLLMHWRETGGPPVAPSAHPGYGTSVIRDLIPHQLDGAVELGFSADGVRCRLELPLARVSPVS